MRHAIRWEYSFPPPPMSSKQAMCLWDVGCSAKPSLGTLKLVMHCSGGGSPSVARAQSRWEEADLHAQEEQQHDEPHNEWPRDARVAAR